MSIPENVPAWIIVFESLLIVILTGTHVLKFDKLDGSHLITNTKVENMIFCGV